MTFAPAGQAGGIIMDGLVSTKGTDFESMAAEDRTVEAYEANTRMTFPLFDRGIDKAFVSLFGKYCKADAECRKRLGQDPIKFVANLYANKTEKVDLAGPHKIEGVGKTLIPLVGDKPWDNAQQYTYFKCRPVISVLPWGWGAFEFALRLDLLKQLVGFTISNKGLRLFLAPIFYRLDRCNDVDKTVVGNVLLMLGAATMGIMQPSGSDFQLQFTAAERNVLRTALANVALASKFGLSGLSPELDSALAGISLDLEAASADSSSSSSSKPKAAVRMGSAVSFSAMIRTLIGNSEMGVYPEDPSDEMARAFFDKSFGGFGMGMYNDSTAWAAAGGNYARDRANYWNLAVKFDHPDDPSVLYLQGDTDPQTPHEFAEFAFGDAIIPADKKKLVTYPGAVHGTFLFSPMSVVKGVNVSTCALWNIVNFVGNEGDLSKVDDCTKDMLKLTFDCTDAATGFYDAEACPMMARNLLGTGDSLTDGDMYDGAYQIPVMLEFIVLMVELALMTVICCTCCFCWGCLGARRAFCPDCCDCINCSCCLGPHPSKEPVQVVSSSELEMSREPSLQSNPSQQPWGMGGRDGGAPSPANAAQGQQPAQGETFTVTVPEKAQPGEKIQVPGPKGTLVEVQVPAGSGPGSQFQALL